MDGRRLTDDYNLVVILGVVITIITTMWFAFQDIKLGFVYTILFTTSTILLFTVFFIKEGGTRSLIWKKLKTPFSTSTPVAAFLLIIGWVIILILSFAIQSGTDAFKIQDYMIPLAAEKTNVLIQQTGVQLSISSSKSLELWNTVFNAAFIEEWVFGFVGIFVFYALWLMVIRGLFKSRINHGLLLGLSILSVALLFSFLHKLNGSYTTFNQFFIAAMFRVVMLLIVYYLGFALAFTIGIHQANNFVWYVNQYGWPATKDALFSTLGIVMILYMVVMIVITFNNLRDISRFWSNIVRDIRKSTGGATV